MAFSLPILFDFSKIIMRLRCSCSASRSGLLRCVAYVSSIAFDLSTIHDARVFCLDEKCCTIHLCDPLLSQPFLVKLVSSTCVTSCTDILSLFLAFYTKACLFRTYLDNASMIAVCDLTLCLAGEIHFYMHTAGPKGFHKVHTFEMRSDAVSDSLQKIPGRSIRK